MLSLSLAVLHWPASGSSLTASKNPWTPGISARQDAKGRAPSPCNTAAPGHGAAANDQVRSVGGARYAELIARRFALACKRLKLNREQKPLDTGHFRPPGRQGQGTLAL